MSRNFNLKINGHHYSWNDQYISGADVRIIGKVPVDEELYLKIKGPGEDELIGNDQNINLAEPGIEQFYSKKDNDNHTKIIIVNGREKEWNEKTISFKEVVILAFGTYIDNEMTVYTVTYKRGHGNKPEGTMVKGDVVKVKNKMIFNVTATDKS